MMQIITKHNINMLLQNPKEYISSEQDEVLLKFVNEDTQNCFYIMVGYDEDKERYYLVLEDDEQTADIYCESSELFQKYHNLINYITHCMTQFKGR